MAAQLGSRLTRCLGGTTIGSSDDWVVEGAASDPASAAADVDAPSSTSRCFLHQGGAAAKRGLQRFLHQLGAVAGRLNSTKFSRNQSAIMSSRHGQRIGTPCSDIVTTCPHSRQMGGSTAGCGQASAWLGPAMAAPLAAQGGESPPRRHWIPSSAVQVQLQMDQPLAAVEAYRRGLDKFPGEAALIAPMARVYEGLHDLQRSAKLYRDLLTQDAVHVEAIACVATHHFYADQPEMALRFYRRLLQLGMPTAELYNNLALCCFYAQQYDMALTCFDRALALAEDHVLADVWYNLGLVALTVGDKALAIRSFRLALVYDSGHAESYNNLGVLELTNGNVAQATAYFVTAGEMAPELSEAHYNHALVLEQTGDLQGCARAASKCPNYGPSADLLKKVQAFFHKH
ncbi:tetratricopeptide repeat protein 8-like [Haemaphysalis longicornis]